MTSTLVHEERHGRSVSSTRRQIRTREHQQNNSYREVDGDQDDVQADMQRRARGQKRVQAANFNDYSDCNSVITSNLYVNEKYTKIMITEIYQQSAKKPESPPGHRHRFLLFLVQHHWTKITKIMQDAGLQQRDIKDVYDYFDEKAAQQFNRPNVRNLMEMTEMQRQQQLERLRPPPVHQAQHDGYSDIEELQKKRKKKTRKMTTMIRAKDQQRRQHQHQEATSRSTTRQSQKELASARQSNQQDTT
eukprot:5512446-Amphidinium_carterae.2